MTPHRASRGMAAVLLGLAVAACGGEPAEEPPELTRREKDAAVARSGLPGSGAVGRLLKATDSIAARNERLDSMVR